MIHDLADVLKVLKQLAHSIGHTSICKKTDVLCDCGSGQEQAAALHAAYDILRSYPEIQK